MEPVSERLTMPVQMKAYRVFIASPGGLDAERRKFNEILSEYNRIDGYARGIIYIPVGWEETLGGVGRPQSFINDDVKKCDYFLLLLWDRWGSRPSADNDSSPFTSGTEEEFSVAKGNLHDMQKPMRDIIILFKSINERQLADPGEQLQKVLDFKKNLEETKEFYFRTFDVLEKFEYFVRQHLAQWTRDDENGIDKNEPRGGPGSPAETLTPAGSDDVKVETLPCKEKGTAKQTTEEIQKAWKLAEEGKLTEAENLFAKSVVYSSSPKTLNDYAVFLKRIGRINQAEMMHQRGVELSELSGDFRSLAANLCNLGSVYLSRGLFDKAEETYNKSLVIEKQLGSLEGTANNYCNLGMVYQIRGYLEKAEELFNKALEINKRLNRLKEIAGVYCNLGVVYKTRGQFDKAEDLFNESLKITKKLGCLEETATLYRNIGAIHQTRGQLDKAEEMYNKALKIEKQLGHFEGMAGVYCNLGIIYHKRGQFDKAEEIFNKALEISQQIGHLEGMANAYGNLGNTYRTRNRLEKAEDMYKKALEIDERLGRRESIAVAYGNIGIIYGIRGQLDRAEEMFNKALEIDQQLGRLEGMANQYCNLGNVYEKRERKEKAIEFWRKAKGLYEQLGANDKAEEIQRGIEGLEEK
jgi:tetratricopeptide (TPR) repeat protein